MSLTTTAVFAIAVLLILLFLRMPVGYVMAFVGFVGFSYVVSVDGGLYLLGQALWTRFSDYGFTVIPMFVLMGSIAYHSGISARLYDAAYKWVGHVHGGLAAAAVGACAAFAACCGSTSAATAAMGKVTLAEMKRYRYDSSLSTGCLAASGSLAILIPPSTTLIVYGILVEESIASVFAAGILPGLLVATLFATAILIVCRVNPALGPPGARTPWKARIAALAGFGEMLALFVIVMGGLFIGIFTPTEAGAVGAAGALVIGAARRRLSWQGFLNALSETTRITAMVFLIIGGGAIFSRFMAATRVPFDLADWVSALPLSPTLVMLAILLGYLIAGCFMDALALIILTVPILYPVVLKLGFDPIWFGVIVTVMTEIGVITPPVGVNVYIIKGIAADVPLESIFKGTLPFLAALIVTVLVLVAFPQVVLFLPGLLVAR